jgi:crossover junction endodeoxyribonuclease RuvC
MQVMGIDPGTVKMGVGLIAEEKNMLNPLFFKTVSISSKLPLYKRLLYIYEVSHDLFKNYQPDVIALEDFFYALNFKIAIRIGEARCAVILAAAQCNIEVVEYLPTRVKQAVCGFGRASKIQMQHMVKNILHLESLPPSDTADALALALCHIHGNTMRKKMAYV